ncbi:MAG: nitrogen assimilation response regulator NtrX [Wenzhouxiangellaceae bacterium]
MAADGTAPMDASILIVDDEPDIRELIGEILSDEGYRPLLAADADEAERLLAKTRPALILLDVWMPGTDGISLLKRWRAANGPGCPVVMISGHGSVEAAVEATRHGAVDFIEKPIAMARLLDTVRRHLSEPAGGDTHAGTRASPTGRIELIGRSAVMEGLRHQLTQAARSRCHVLIEGEPGSGRTHAARWMLTRCEPAAGSVLEIGCEPARFMNVMKDLDAQGFDPSEALILDRIERLNEDCQQWLRDWLDTAGRSCRVVAVAAPELRTRVERGLFDPDLYRRLAQLVVTTPPLRERSEDIPDLVRAFIEELPERDGLPYRPVPVAAQNRLRQHAWHGNLPELRNVLRRLLAAGEGTPVEVDEIDALLNRPVDPASLKVTHSPLFELPLREAREAFERHYLIARLREVDGSVGQLAEVVEMERTHLYRKLRQLGIDPRQVVEGD